MLTILALKSKQGEIFTKNTAFPVITVLLFLGWR